MTIEEWIFRWMSRLPEQAIAELLEIAKGKR